MYDCGVTIGRENFQNSKSVRTIISTTPFTKNTVDPHPHRFVRVVYSSIPTANKQFVIS